MKEIPLSREMVALVDDEDYAELSKHRWFATRATGSRTWYAGRNAKNGENVSTKWVLMHRAIMRAGRGQMIDHADHNGLNNTRANLRFCSHSQNVANRPLPVSAYGYRGVTPSTRRWRARIRLNGRNVLIGTYDTREQAAEAYDRAALQLFGEFAILNFPDRRAA